MRIGNIAIISFALSFSAYFFLFHYIYLKRFITKKFHAFRSPPKRYHYQCRRNEPFHAIIRFRLYLLVHDDDSLSMAKMWSSCASWVSILKIPSTKYFESIVYLQSLPALRHEWKSSHLIGLCTYRSVQYLSLEKLKVYVELAYHGKYDVIPLINSGERLIDQAVYGHTTSFLQVWEAFLMRLGYLKEKIHESNNVEVFFRNTFIITPTALNSLINFIQRCMFLCETDSNLKAILETNANYRESIFRKDTSYKIFKKPYYEWHPFIFERLPSFYFHIHNFSVFTILSEIESFGNIHQHRPSLD